MFSKLEPEQRAILAAAAEIPSMVLPIVGGGLLEHTTHNSLLPLAVASSIAYLLARSMANVSKAWIIEDQKRQAKYVVPRHSLIRRIWWPL